MNTSYSWTMFVKIFSSIMHEMKSSGFISTDALEFPFPNQSLTEGSFKTEIIVGIAYGDLLEFYGCLDSNML
jgi:hypothetical protein